MRILVSFKVTPDYEALRDADWGEGPVAAGVPSVETRFVRRVLNVFDESALELALRLTETEAQPGMATVTRWSGASLAALTVGDRTADPFLTTLLALGFEPATRIEAAAAELDFCPARTAALIAAHARTMAPDLLLLGTRSGPGGGGTVPFRLSEELGWPCLAQVTAIEPLPDGRLRVAAETDDGLLSVTMRPPCILAIGNAIVSHLRAPTLTARLAARERRVDVLPPGGVGVDAPARARAADPTLVRLERVHDERAGVVIEGADAREKAQRLYDGYLRDRLAAP